MTLLLTKQDRTSQIKKKIRILKQRPQECKKELFFARLLPDGSVRTQGHIAEGGVVLDSLKVRIVLDVGIGYVEEKKVARIKGVTLESLEIESFLRFDGRFWQWPFKTSAIAHGEYHRKVAEDWWRDKALGIIADILKGLEEEIDAARHKRGDMNTREAQAIINRKMPGIILKLKNKFKEQAPIYPMDEPEARRAQLSAGPIRIWENFQIAALVNVRFGYMRQEIMEIQKIVGAQPDGLYGKNTLEAVRKHQKHLTELGLYKGPANGLWDTATQSAHEKYAAEAGEEERQEPFGKEGKWKLGQGGRFEKPEQVAFIAQKGATLSSLVKEMNDFVKAKEIDYEYNVGQWREWIAGAEKGDVKGEPAPELPHLIGIGNILWVKGPIVDAVKERVEEKGVAEIKRLIRTIAAKRGVDAAIALAIARAESDFNPRAVSTAGAMGVYQLMPITIKDLKARFKYEIKDPFDPEQNINGGLIYFKWLYQRYNKNLDKALAAWNWGLAHIPVRGPMPELFPETRKFIKNVKRYIKMFEEGKE